MKRASGWLRKHNWMHLAFQADLPALGYRCYRLSFPEDALTWNPTATAAAVAIENEHLRLALDPHSGWLTSLYSKDLGIELLRAPGSVPLAIADPSDTWSHDVVSFDDEAGRFHAQGSVSVVERGPVRQVLRACCQQNASQITADYTLYAGSRQVILDLGLTGARCTVTWQPHEIKTLRWRPGDPATGATAPAAVNMLEEAGQRF